MEYSSGQDCLQLQMNSMYNIVSQDNMARFVDAFVEKLDLEKLGFQVLQLQNEGRPDFERKVLLKLYLKDLDFHTQKHIPEISIA